MGPSSISSAWSASEVLNPRGISGLGASSETAPATADLDRDGYAEIVLGAAEWIRSA